MTYMFSLIINIERRMKVLTETIVRLMVLFLSPTERLRKKKIKKE